jgi:DNA sulfur modification protein DndC
MITEVKKTLDNKRYQFIINEIIDQYAYADHSQRPWIIGFSGGKDSTVLLTFVWEALLQLKNLPTPFQLRRPVYVVCNDTLVENPLIAHYRRGKRARSSNICKTNNTAS